MKILHKGQRREWWEGKIGVCKDCNTQFQLEAGDKVSVQSDRNETLASIPCPTCKADVWVYPNSPNASDWARSDGLTQPRPSVVYPPVRPEEREA